MRQGAPSATLDDPLEPLVRLLARARRAGRAAGVHPDLRLGEEPPPGWVPAHQLADAALPHLQDLVLSGAREWRAGPYAAALLSWKRYAHWVTLPLALGWALNRRVPLVAADRVRVRVGRTGPRVALAGPDVAVLPDDPCAGMPGTTVVADEEALLAAARTALVECHLAPVAAALRALVPVAERPLLGSIAAALAQPLVTLAPMLPGDPVTAVPALMGGVGPDLAALVDLVPVTTAAGATTLSLRRRTCCLAFAVRGLSPCESCPLGAGRG